MGNYTLIISDRIVLKTPLKKEGSELATNCSQQKMLFVEGALIT